jgi:hypothetical protein
VENDMLLSHDYTRVAVLTDDIIQRIMDKYHYRGGLELEDIKRLNNSVRELMEHRLGQVDLVTEWIIQSLDKGSGIYPEDFSNFMNAALFFLARSKEPKFKQAVKSLSEEKGRVFNPKNILDFTLHDVFDLEETYKGEPEDPRVNLLQKKVPLGASLIYNGHGYQIIRVEKSEAACELGRGTKWCTSNAEVAQQYLNKSPLYVIYKNGKKFGQLHLDETAYSSGIQFMDLRDRPIVEIDYELRQALTDSGLMKKILFEVKKIPDHSKMREQYLLFTGG